jgi:hypothetical protein
MCIFETQISVTRKIAAILNVSDMAILDLSVNGISGIGAKALVDAAKESRLNLLDLSHNTGIPQTLQYAC